MTLYRLYLESASYQSPTMVHVLHLPGCVAVGPTTEAALDATPEAINAFRRFLHRAGEDVKLVGERSARRRATHRASRAPA